MQQLDLPCLALATRTSPMEQIPVGAQMYVINEPAALRTKTNQVMQEGNVLPVTLLEAWWKGMRVRLRFKHCDDPDCTMELKLEGTWRGKHPMRVK